MKKILSVLIVLSLFLTSCTLSNDKYTGDIIGDAGEHIGVTLYGKYAENIPENYVEELEDLDKLYQEFRADAENIYEAVKVADLTGYEGMVSEDMVYEGLPPVTILDIAEDGELWARTNIYINEMPITVILTYDIEERDGRWETGYVGIDPIYMNYFPEPIIKISFYLSGIKPSYNVSNALLYTVDGELVGEYNKWFIYGEGAGEAVRDELAEFYFNEALRIIGK